jgi:hypothetical protein
VGALPLSSFYIRSAEEPGTPRWHRSLHRVVVRVKLTRGAAYGPLGQRKAVEESLHEADVPLDPRDKPVNNR